MIAFKLDRDGSGFEEALAGVGAHIGEELLVVAEALDEAGVDLALHLEDAGPATIFKEGSSEPEENSHEYDERGHRGKGLYELSYDWRGFLAGAAFIPGSAEESLAATAAGVGEVGEEIKVGVADDFRMILQKSCELGVGAADVLQVGEKGRVGADDVGERGAHPEEMHELSAGFCDVALGGDGSRGHRLRRGFGWLGIACGTGGEKKQKRGRSNCIERRAVYAHPDIPLCEWWLL